MLQDLKNARTIVQWVAWAEPDYDFGPVMDEWCNEVPKELNFNLEAGITLSSNLEMSIGELWYVYTYIYSFQVCGGPSPIIFVQVYKTFLYIRYLRISQHLDRSLFSSSVNMVDNSCDLVTRVCLLCN